MRGIVETPTETDVRNRCLFVLRIDEFDPAAFEAAQTQIGGEALARGFEQLLQVALRDALFRREKRETEFRVAKARIDTAADAREDGRL